MRDIEKIISEIIKLKREIIVDYQKYSDKVWNVDDSFNIIIEELKKINIDTEEYKTENACRKEPLEPLETQNTKYHYFYEKKL